jgi:hypothetical protein
MDVVSMLGDGEGLGVSWGTIGNFIGAFDKIECFNEKV